MKKHKKGRKKRRQLFIIIDTILVIIIVLIGVALLMHLNSNNTGAPAEDIENHALDAEVDKEYISDDLSVDIPYGVIRFPKEFSDYTYIEIEDTEDRYKVEFCCKYEENIVPLFTVAFGEPEEGATVIGQLGDAGETSIDVSIQAFELVLDTEWANENAELLYSMQEAVNDIMGDFESSYEFRPVS